MMGTNGKTLEQSYRRLRHRIIFNTDHCYYMHTRPHGYNLAGVGMEDGAVGFNGTVAMGMWAITQNVANTQAAELISLGICCNPHPPKPPAPWVPATDCDPACNKTVSRCCRDPDSPPPGVCMGSAAHPITDCSQIKPRAGVEAAPVGTLDRHPHAPAHAAPRRCRHLPQGV